MANSTKGKRGWFSDSAGHAKAGKAGGKARKEQMEESGMSYEELGQLGGEAAQRSGRAHRLTAEERARGGKRSHKSRNDSAR